MSHLALSLHSYIFSLVEIIFSTETCGSSLFVLIVSSSFLPNSPEGLSGYVFTHGVRMGGWVGGQREKFVWPVSQKL